MKKIQAWTGHEPITSTIPVQCSTKWVIRPTGSWALFSKAPETFRTRKAIFSSSVSKNGELYMLETSCIKGTSVHITNVWINQPCNHKIWDFARLSGCKNFSGPSRNGPQTRFWVYADYPFRILDQSDLPDLTGSPRFADIRTSGVWLSKMFLFLVTDQRDRGFWGLQWENRN